jgi:hypothetical protein
MIEEHKFADSEDFKVIVGDGRTEPHIKCACMHSASHVAADIIGE